MDYLTKICTYLGRLYSFCSENSNYKQTLITGFILATFGLSLCACVTDNGTAHNNQQVKSYQKAQENQAKLERTMVF